MIAGVQKHLSGASAVIVDGSSYTPAAIVKSLQGSIDSADATASATAAFHKATAAERAANTTGDGLYLGLRTYLVTQYKTQPDVLADFGITLGSRRVPDASTMATAVVKRAATRAARHTMGKRQKLAVTGTVSTTAPATTATASQPSVTQSQSASAPPGTSAAAAPHAS
jgi:hypothetical protein